MQRNGLKRIGVVVSICALIGALAGIAGSAAAPSSSKSKAAAAAKKKAAQKKARAQRRAMRMRGPGPGGPGFMHGPGGPAVHSEAVVPQRDGSGFTTVTTDSGTLNSVDGTTLHIKEGTDDETYKDDVAVDVGDDAKVIRNGDEAALGDLKEGDHVHVVVSDEGAFVMAADDDFIAQMRKRGPHGFGHREGHFEGPPPAGGAPGAAGDSRS